MNSTGINPYQPSKSLRILFILSLLVSASGLLGIFACRTMAKDAFFDYFVGCDAYLVLIPLFLLGLLAAAFLCFCKKAAKPMLFGPAAAFALIYTVLLLLPSFRYWFTDTAEQAIYQNMPDNAVLQEAMLCNFRDLSSHKFTKEEFPAIEALLRQTPLDTKLPNQVIRSQGTDFFDGYWFQLTYYTPENRSEYWNIVIYLDSSPVVAACFEHINGFEIHEKTPRLLCYTGSPGLYQLVEQFEGQMQPIQ